MSYASDMKKELTMIEITRDSKSYLYQNSLYFGASGFLWALILLFERTGDIFYKNNQKYFLVDKF